MFVTDEVPTPERRILCEIAYQHRDMTAAVFRIGAGEVEPRESASSQNAPQVASEGYEICFFAFRLGQTLDFLRLVARADTGEPALKRRFLLYILRDSKPPFSQAFLAEMLVTLSAPNVRALFVPEAGRQAAPAMTQALTVLLQFVEQLNKGEGTRTRECDVRPYDELRKELRRVHDLAKGTGQMTLRGFW
jgi:hypothetical protein